MPYSVHPLPEEPDQGDSAHPPLVRIYVVAGVFIFTAVAPHADRPDCLPADQSHIELQRPGTRVDDLRRIGATSTSVASPNLTSFGSWFATRG